MIRTLRDFLEEVGGLSYDNGDFWAVRDKFRDREIQAFVDCFLPGTQILRDGKNGAPVAMKGLAGGLINNSRAAFAFMTQFDHVLPIW